MLNLQAETDAVLDCVCEAYGIKRSELLSNVRTQPIGEARIIGYFLARSRGMSFPRIGRIFNRDHTSVMNGVKTAVKVMARDAAVARLVATFCGQTVDETRPTDGQSGDRLGSSSVDVLTTTRVVDCAHPVDIESPPEVAAE
jgi:hypothetical protein